MGYVTRTRGSLHASERSRRYADYKNRVRALADDAGVPEELDNESSVAVDVSVQWKKKQRIDIDNVLKAVTDSCFKRDRRVLKASVYAREYQGHEEAAVKVTVIEVD